MCLETLLSVLSRHVEILHTTWNCTLIDTYMSATTAREDAWTQRGRERIQAAKPGELAERYKRRRDSYERALAMVNTDGGATNSTHTRKEFAQRARRLKEEMAAEAEKDELEAKLNQSKRHAPQSFTAGKSDDESKPASDDGLETRLHGELANLQRSGARPSVVLRKQAQIDAVLVSRCVLVHRDIVAHRCTHREPPLLDEICRKRSPSLRQAGFTR